MSTFADTLIVPSRFIPMKAKPWVVDAESIEGTDAEVKKERYRQERFSF